MEALIPLLAQGDVVIDGGNANYKDTLRRSACLREHGLHLVDVGTSGGVWGLSEGYCLMVGGEEQVVQRLAPIFEALAPAPDKGWGYVGPNGAGHFVKMVHNGIEYGMMQALAEGFSVMQASDYELDLTAAAEVYNHGSVIESRLVGWLAEAFEVFGEDLAPVSPTVAHTGEGEWTVRTAEKLGVAVKIIEGALEFRKQSEHDPSYAGRVLSALRNRFGGHAV